MTVIKISTNTDKYCLTDREARTHNSTFAIGGVSCFVGQKSAKFKLCTFKEV